MEEPKRREKGGKILTKDEAVGLSRIASSSCVKGNKGMILVRSGTSNKMIIGNPMDAREMRMQAWGSEL